MSTFEVDADEQGRDAMELASPTWWGIDGQNQTMAIAMVMR